jgi:P-type Ca2+ transporter type 2C
MHGLNTPEVQELREKYGFNEITKKKSFSVLKIFFSQFLSFLILILVIAGVVSVLLGEYVDGIAIFAIIIINAIIGFVQEYKADRSLKALKKMIVQHTVVYRDGVKKEIPSRELIPGDLVLLFEGDKVPADAKIIKSFGLKLDESMLTGESNSVSKVSDDLIYSGTIVVSGKLTARVLSIGKSTEFGKIVDLVSKEEKPRTKLTLQLDKLAKGLGILIIVLIFIIFILGLFRDYSAIELFMVSVSLGVSAIPEGLPIVVTITLALGILALSRRNAIVRKMNSVETLGSATIICSDKTGTLTLNEMTVKKIKTLNFENSISGTGYNYDNKINILNNENKMLLDIAENCNNAYVNNSLIGDPTEIALKVLTRKSDYVNEYKEIDEIPFSSERKMMSSLHLIKNNKIIYTKGAFEEVIGNCDYILDKGRVREITKKDKELFVKVNEKYAKKALRVLGFAYKEYSNFFNENKMIFVGLVGMMDPPRPEVKQSLMLAKRAGIKVKIITGDNPLTAKAVADLIGLKTSKIMLGNEVENLSDTELKKALKTVNLFARTTPEHKYRIVNCLKEMGEIVAVTGDGVNDAPALKKADIGIAMGIKGTEASKEVSDIILKDDNFSTIVNAIEEGRRIYRNILSFVKYMLSANFDAILTVGILTVIGLPLPLLALQILWINIATDSLPALALGQQKANKDIMKEKPESKKGSIFKKFIIFILVASMLQLITNLILFFYGSHLDVLAGINTFDLSQPSHARTLVFTGIVLFELMLVFVCTSNKAVSIKEMFSNKYLLFAVLISFALQLFVIYNSFMQSVFKTVGLGWFEWLLVFIFSFTAFLVPLIEKLIKRIFNIHIR